MEKVHQVFHHIDKDGSGEIDVDEIMKFFDICNTPVDCETATMLLREADSDGSGTISKEGKRHHCGISYTHTHTPNMYVATWTFSTKWTSAHSAPAHARARVRA